MFCNFLNKSNAVILLKKNLMQLKKIVKCSLNNAGIQGISEANSLSKIILKFVHVYV